MNINYTQKSHYCGREAPEEEDYDKKGVEEDVA